MRPLLSQMRSFLSELQHLYFCVGEISLPTTSATYSGPSHPTCVYRMFFSHPLHTECHLERSFQRLFRSLGLESRSLVTPSGAPVQYNRNFRSQVDLLMWPGFTLALRALALDHSWMFD
eukprot:3188028-Amphidinium_carterae.1